MKDFFRTHRVLLAPMAGISDVPMRFLCVAQGAQLCYSEMVSAKALSYSNKKTIDLLCLAPNEEKIAIQIFGHDADEMSRQAQWLEQNLGSRLAYIDINMGCPARKIISGGDGAKLMTQPKLAAHIVSSVSSSVSVPVTCKFRRGFEIGQDSAVDFALRMQEAGAAAVCVHGRYAKQLYNGAADWDIIAQVCESLDIPVIANGDIDSAEAAMRILTHTKCDALMVARAARGNPWIFSQVRAALEGREIPLLPSYKERLITARRHAELLDKCGGKQLLKMRKHGAWYISGMPGARFARKKLYDCVSIDDFCEVFFQLEHYLDNISSHSPDE